MLFMMSGNGNQDGKLQTSQELKKISSQLLKDFLNLNHSSNQLPLEDDYEYYMDFSAFKNFSHNCQNQILQVIGAALTSRSMAENFTEASIKDQEDVDIDELTESLVSCNDLILEKIASSMEALDKKAECPLLKPTSLNSSSSQAASSNAFVAKCKKVDKKGKVREYLLYQKVSVQRPQVHFKDKVDNSQCPFVPKILHKPNALKELPKALVEFHEKNLTDSSETVSNFVHSTRIDAMDECVFDHPYEYEINSFTPKPFQLEKSAPIMYEKLVPIAVDEVVDSLSALNTLVDELKSVHMIAVDLKGHSYRSFLGFTCLLQISTQKKDYIIDALKLRSELHILNEIFTDPNIVKVLHNAEKDVLWMQRDFGLYLVNMFDIALAARSLNKRYTSLKYLLMHYCKVEASKHFQLVDWRIRPLNSQLISFAQRDTHYLPYMYDVARCELLNRNAQLLHSVIDESRRVCLTRFEKPESSEQTYLKSRDDAKRLDGRQLAVCKALHAWRDITARSNDESLTYVLPTHMLVGLSAALPTKPDEVLAACKPLPPPLVRANRLDIIHLVGEALDDYDAVDVDGVTVGVRKGYKKLLSSSSPSSSGYDQWQQLSDPTAPVVDESKQSGNQQQSSKDYLALLDQSSSSLGYPSRPDRRRMMGRGPPRSENPRFGAPRRPFNRPEAYVPTPHKRPAAQQTPSPAKKSRANDGEAPPAPGAGRSKGARKRRNKKLRAENSNKAKKLTRVEAFHAHPRDDGGHFSGGSSAW